MEAGAPMIAPQRNQVYLCPNCGGTFRPTGEECLVIHPQGTCCHYGDVDVSTGRNARVYDPKMKGGTRKPGEVWR